MQQWSAATEDQQCLDPPAETRHRKSPPTMKATDEQQSNLSAQSTTMPSVHSCHSSHLSGLELILEAHAVCATPLEDLLRIRPISWSELWEMQKRTRRINRRSRMTNAEEPRPYPLVLHEQRCPSVCDRYVPPRGFLLPEDSSLPVLASPPERRRFSPKHQ